jgi:AraC family transcriptional regulator
VSQNAQRQAIEDHAGLARRGLNMMTHHGEVVRHPAPKGDVFLSRLGAGSSRIVALAPSVRYVLQGEEHYNIDGRLRRVRAGEFMLVEAGTDSATRIPVTGETIGLCIYLPATPRGLILNDVASTVVMGGSGDPLAAVLTRFARAAVRGAPLCPLQLTAATASGAEDFLARFHQRRDRLNHRRPAVRTEVMQRLERARAVIHAGADGPLTLEEVCREAALSRFYLTRMFTEVYGLPPLAYHRRLRLDRAAAKLQHDLATPKELAEQLGYGSLSAFSRAFRSQFGVPPSRHREA